MKQLGQFYGLMSRTAQVRRQIVECVLKGLPIRPHFRYSLENAKVKKLRIKTLKNNYEVSSVIPILIFVNIQFLKLTKQFLEFSGKLMQKRH